jgi:serine/threonine protein kinase
MTFTREVGAEPVPGYRLIEPLGVGGFGEVWKCEAPGGLCKAIKFVGRGDGVTSPAEQELAALQRVKSIRHPFILSLDRVEVIDGVLLIIMELADRSLNAVQAECQQRGQKGIPRDQLLDYLVEAAEALDWMNFEHGLQHLDIKPHNLFLVSNHVKVADFGLVHSLGDGPAGAVRQRRGGVTPLYAAPEILRGSFSRHSDQYSLAIAYQQLLTGTVPFWDENLYQLVHQHLSFEPNLNDLPVADRPLVARALAKVPEQRFESCSDFLRALLSVEPPPAVSTSVRPSGIWRRVLLPPRDEHPPAPPVAPSRGPQALAPTPIPIQAAERTRLVPVPTQPTQPCADTPPLAADLNATLPPVIPFASLLGEPPTPGTVLPPLAQLVQAVWCPSEPQTVAGPQNARYHLHPDGSWEHHCPVEAFPGTVPIKVEGFRAHWNARVTGREGDSFALQLDLQAPRRFWERAKGPPRRLQVELRVEPLGPLRKRLTEAHVRIRAVSGPAEEMARVLAEMGPRLLDSLRSFLQAGPEQRRRQRHACPLPLHVYPVLPHLQLAELLVGVGRSISTGGISFHVAGPPPAEQLYLHFPGVAAARDYALLARVVRRQPDGAGGFEVGAMFPST